MFTLIKYGVGCTLSIKHTLLDWSWKLVPRCGLAGSSTSGPVLFCLSCFCMGVHARACRRVAFVRAGHMHARWFRWFRPCMRVGFGQGHRTHAGALLSFGRDVMARTGWEAKFHSLVFIGFVHIFATARWLTLKQIFRHVFILALCLLSLPI